MTEWAIYSKDYFQRPYDYNSVRNLHWTHSKWKPNTNKPIPSAFIGNQFRKVDLEVVSRVLKSIIKYSLNSIHFRMRYVDTQQLNAKKYPTKIQDRVRLNKKYIIYLPLRHSNTENHLIFFNFTGRRVISFLFSRSYYELIINNVWNRKTNR